MPTLPLRCDGGILRGMDEPRSGTGWLLFMAAAFVVLLGGIWSFTPV